MYHEEMATRSVKKQRNSTACDGCRKRKIKCDSSQYPGSRCSNCIDFDIQCTYCQPTKKRGPKSKYVQSLEAKLKALIQDQESRDPSLLRSPSESRATSVAEDVQDLSYLELMEQLSKLNVSPVKERFFGPRSGLMMFKNVMAKGAKGGKPGGPGGPGGPRRMQYWTEPMWEGQTESSDRWCVPYIFPEPDWSDSLVAIYFTKIHPSYPILHRPSFEKLYQDGAHFENRHFGTLLLLVCANAARYSDDPRTLLRDSPFAELSAGWQWYEQVPAMRKNLFHSTTLYELQAYCLSALYLMGSSAAIGALYIITTALRMAEDMGLHRRKPDGYQMTAEYEMLKRNFWVLYCLERIVGGWAGRSFLLSDRDIDVELPVECDDKHWIIQPNGAVQFRQPNRQPSLIVAFNRHVSLCRIFTKCQKLSRGNLGDERDQQIVAQIDASLSDWLKSLPDHLRWVDPPLDASSSVFYEQSAVIHTLYYFIQILVHQSFIATPLPLSERPVSICINAAKASSYALEVLAKRRVYVVHLPLAGFVTGAVLLMIKQEGKALPSDPSQDIERAKRVLKVFENRWYGCGRLRDMLNIISEIQDPCYKIPPMMQSARSILELSPQSPSQHVAYMPSPAPVGFPNSPVEYPGAMFDQSLNINPEHSLYQMLAFYSGPN